MMVYFVPCSDKPGRKLHGILNYEKMAIEKLQIC